MSVSACNLTSYFLSCILYSWVTNILSCPSCILSTERLRTKYLRNCLLASTLFVPTSKKKLLMFEKFSLIRLISPGGNLTQDADYNFLPGYFWLVKIQRRRIQSASVQFSPALKNLLLDTLALFLPVATQNTIINFHACQYFLCSLFYINILSMSMNCQNQYFALW